MCTNILSIRSFNHLIIAELGRNIINVKVHLKSPIKTSAFYIQTNSGNDNGTCMHKLNIDFMICVLKDIVLLYLQIIDSLQIN